MKGLLLKELFMLRKTLVPFTILILVFSLLGVIGVEPSMLIMIPIFLSIWTFSLLNADDVSRWRQYSIALPYGRKTIVSLKYLIVLFLDVVSVIIVSCCYMISVYLKKIDFSAGEIFVLIFLSIISGLIYPMMVLPLYYIFNSEKSRMLIMLFSGIVGGTATFFMNLSPVNMDIFSRNTEIVMLIILASVALLFTLSWILSIKIYEKKDL